MLRTNDLRRLDRLGQLLGAALASEDWTRIGEIDLLIREGLQRLSVAGELDAELQARLEPLKALHAQALHACTRECQRVGSLLGRHTEHGEGRRAYSLLDSVQGED
ncbi:hypothetical protein [Pseudomonas sp. DSV-1]|uniref:hypothetical protein n=1 Tax=Pseudomonas sp. DSV-1 TaxID=3112250 RepID=UPI002DBCD1E7|nr:hypothetical protein [Pseudomonas sp. DSV-1]MEC4239903.1 hypothetical protein [Pseudomonas sp. DSV-1]